MQIPFRYFSSFLFSFFLFWTAEQFNNQLTISLVTGLNGDPIEFETQQTIKYRLEFEKCRQHEWQRNEFHFQLIVLGTLKYYESVCHFIVEPHRIVLLCVHCSAHRIHFFLSFLKCFPKLIMFSIYTKLSCLLHNPDCNI